MRKYFVTTSIVMLIMALLLTLAPACGNGDEESEITPTPGVTPTPGITPTPGVTPTPEAETLKVGFLGPLTGGAGQFGIDMQQGMKWAADKINEGGGLKVGGQTYLFKVVSYDDKMSGSEAGAGAIKLAHEDNVRFAFGGILSPENGAAMPVFHEAKVIGAGVGAGLCSPEFPYWLDIATHYPTWAAAFDKLVKEYNPDVETLAFLQSESPDAHRSTDATKALLEGFGWTLVAEEYYTMGTSDFYPVLSHIVPKNPDIIDMDSGSGDVALIIKQAREMGYEGKFSNHATVQPAVNQIAGCGYTDGLYSNDPDYGSPLYPEGTRELYQEYLQRYHPENDVMNFLTLLGYTGVMLYAQAAEEADSIDPDEVIKVFDDPEWRFDWFGAPGLKLGGFETYGIRRQATNYVALSVTEDCEVVMKGLSLVEVP